MWFTPTLVLLTACLQLASGGTSAAQPDAAALAGTGVIRGRVVEATHGTPIPRAIVVASLSQAPPNGQPGRVSGRGFSARTGPDGSFVIANLPAGRFTLSAQRPDFFPVLAAAASALRPVDVGASGEVVAPDLLLSRGGVIQGQVLDDAGEPVIGALVSPVGKVGGGARDVLREAGMASSTDDRGRFRVFGLRPGRYTVQVRPRATHQQLPGLGPLQGDARELLPALARGSGADAAQFVDVDGGSEATLDVRLERGLLSMVTGQVTTEDGGPLGQVMVSLRAASSDMAVHVRGATAFPDGRFQLIDVPPGRYLLVAEESPNAPLRGLAPLARVGWTTVVVEGGTEVAAALTIGSGATAQGRIEVEGGDVAALARGRLRVEARPTDYGALPGNSSGAEVGAERTFVLSGLRGSRVLQVYGLPRGWWVKSATVGGRDALDGYDFPMRGSADPIEIVVSGRPSGVRGIVTATSEVTPGTVVQLMSADAGGLAGDALRARGASVRPDGSFLIEGLRPGRYLLIAYPPDSLTMRRGPDEQREITETHGTPVDVIEGQIVSVSLRLTDR
ncbi:MAG TPA: carboxypeptidase-like regulatory domain-containing protein [Luteitalea sp.]|nr:carboxypeptidase-like regulatory domain-containing protein [Luteitalea sp.]